MNDTATLYFAGGCFWGTEHFFKQINGVLDTRVGYANGHVENPTYEQVCGHQTGFAETVEVKYDPQRLPLTLLVQLFFRTIDPTSVNRQGGDVGPQYRTGIYYTDPALRPLLVAEKAKLAAAIGRPVAVEVEPLHNFYAAEDYHQDYLDVHPGGYCHVPSALFEEARRANADAHSKNTYRKPTDEELRRRLTDVQYAVTQKAATEAPHQNAYDKEFRPGIYVDITTGEPLFLSTDKFES
ncbi:MAG: peptide-methionine (S)-S-oxide reductase MsrA, partial [Prevotellaceae bacterium]|nr:peptide-methionine (S)-S-oxide reductase MsrA [Prevotellaceae bacterium]